MSKFPVKWYDDTFPGAPVLNGTPGSLVNVLDKVLVEGFGENTISGINVQDKKATVTIATADKYVQYSVISISGLSDMTLNGEYRVVSSDTGSFVVEMDTSNGPLSFTDAKVKVPSMGWYKPFSGVNVGIYKRADDSSSEWYLYVIDAEARAAKVKICEKATSIDHIVDYKPFTDNSFWYKSYNADAVKKAYNIIGDNNGFYYRPGNRHTTSNLSNGFTFYVGKTINPTNIIDNFDILISYGKAWNTLRTVLNINASDNNFNSNNPEYADFLRTAEGVKINCACFTETPSLAYDSNVVGLSRNTELFFNDTFTLELKEGIAITDVSSRRRYLPGVYDVTNYKSNPIEPHVILPVDNSFNKMLLYVADNGNASSLSNTYSTVRYGIFFDITGPWR